jgi:hypothetical protein
MAYQIADEPQVSELSAYVVRPTAPLIASMVCGAWLAWPWFAFNAFAMGSPTKKKELALCGAAFAGTAVMAAVLVWLVESELVKSVLVIRLALLGITVYKLTMSQYISTVQSRTFHVYQYYGGAVRAAGKVIAVGALARLQIFGLIEDPFWLILLSGIV